MVGGRLIGVVEPLDAIEEVGPGLVPGPEHLSCRLLGLHRLKKVSIAELSQTSTALLMRQVMPGLCCRGIRPALGSTGRPTVGRREDWKCFWNAITEGLSSGKAA